MFQAFSQKFSFSASLQEFLKSSSIVFAANMFGAVLNYLVIIFVAYHLGGLSEWTAFNNILLLLGVFSTGFATELVKKISFFFTKSSSHAYAYWMNAKRYLLKILLPLFIIGCFFLFIGFILENPHYILLSSIWMTFLLQLYTALYTDFLLSVFSIREFSFQIILFSVLRLLSTWICITLGLEIYSLPLGIIIGSIFAYGYAKVHIKKMETSYIPISISFSPYEYMRTIGKTVLSIFLLYMLFYFPPILSYYILPPSDANIFAVLTQLGTIFHLLVFSFFSLTLPFFVRDNGKRYYIFSLGIIAALGGGSLLISGFFPSFILGVFHLDLFERAPLFLMFYVFYVSLFTVLAVSVRYLIARQSIRFLNTILLGGNLSIYFLYIASSFSFFLVALLIGVLIPVLTLVLYIFLANTKKIKREKREIKSPL